MKIEYVQHRDITLNSVVSITKLEAMAMIASLAESLLSLENGGASKTISMDTTNGRVIFGINVIEEEKIYENVPRLF